MLSELKAIRGALEKLSLLVASDTLSTEDPIFRLMRAHRKAKNLEKAISSLDADDDDILGPMRAALDRALQQKRDYVAALRSE